MRRKTAPPSGVNIDAVHANRPAKQQEQTRWPDGTPRSINNVFSWRNISWKQKA